MGRKPERLRLKNMRPNPKQPYYGGCLGDGLKLIYPVLITELLHNATQTLGILLGGAPTGQGIFCKLQGLIGYLR